MAKDIIMDMKLPRRWWLDSTLSYREAEALDPDVIEERKETQREEHTRRKKSSTWTLSEWQATLTTYRAAGYTEEEAIWTANEGIAPESEEGMDLIAKRKSRIRVKMIEYEDMTREEAIRQCAKELRIHNRKKGNIDEYMFSESTIA